MGIRITSVDTSRYPLPEVAAQPSGEFRRVEVCTGRRTRGSGEARLWIYEFEPALRRRSNATIVLFAHGGSIRPDPVLGVPFFPSLASRAHRLGFDCRFVAVAHRGSRSHTAKRRFTLADRVRDLVLAREIIGALASIEPDAPTILIGNSMGGHVAIMALETIRARGVALLCPAVYSAEAHDLPLGPSFTDALRRPNSWRTSPAFVALREYLARGGRALIRARRDDEIIPPAVNRELNRLISVHGGGGSAMELLPGGHHATTPATQTALLDFIATCSG